ncbi:MAG: metalloregulator ArsR/SmtB family transcription factor [Planctomycetota bacterium]
MRSAANNLGSVLKLLADPTRLRILALLEAEELSVGELAGALGVSQSRVSNHLRPLRETGVLGERHAGPTTYVRLARAANGGPLAGRLWEAVRTELASLPEHAADLVRLEAVLAQRHAREGDFFDRLAEQWDTISGDFEKGQARLRAVTHLLPRSLVVADLGCGTGFMAAALLGQCARLICVDRSQGMLDEARSRLTRARRGTEIEFRCGELDHLPLADGEVDGVLAGMVLHHLPELDSPVAEMRRALKPGGSAVVLELAPHREQWMRQVLGDRHLGLDSSDVLAGFARTGFEDVVLDPVDDQYRPKRPDGEIVSLSLYIVRGRVPVPAARV